MPIGAHCCRTAKAPLGYTLPAFPWYIDQTVGGAVATGTHGSSLQFGSLSSQARPPAHRCSSLCEASSAVVSSLTACTLHLSLLHITVKMCVLAAWCCPDQHGTKARHELCHCAVKPGCGQSSAQDILPGEQVQPRCITLHALQRDGTAHRYCTVPLTQCPALHGSAGIALVPPYQRLLCVRAQVTRVELALPNGTLASVTPASHSHLWRALQARV